MKIVRYMIASWSSIRFLETDIQLLIEDGWIPQGGVFVIYSGFCQTMILYEKPKSPKKPRRKSK